MGPWKGSGTERTGVARERRTLLVRKASFITAFTVAAALAAGAFGCSSPSRYRSEADVTAGEIIASTQREVLGREEPFTVERPSDTLRRRLIEEQGLPLADPVSLGRDYLEPVEHWPEGPGAPPPRRSGEPLPWEGPDTLLLTLGDALEIAARNSGEYQTRKEEIFRVALKLDLERDEFRNTFSGLLGALFESDGEGGERRASAGMTAEGSLSRRLKSGAELTGRIAVDLVRLLTGDTLSSLGLFADATVSVPLLRGAGRHIVTEPLQQAERNVVYAIWEFERFKGEFITGVATAFFIVIQSQKEVENAEENYRGLIISTRRARRLAESGRLPWFQYDQSLQNELRSRDRWISARTSQQSRLDGFKIILGLPADGRITLDGSDLAAFAARAIEKVEVRDDGGDAVPPADAPVVLRQPEGGFDDALGIDERKAVETALERRLDLKVALGRINDAQRAVVVAADSLKGELTLLGSAQGGERRTAGGAELPDASLDFSEGIYRALLTFDPPFERTAERNAYRESFIELERSIREFQELEDRVKREVRERLRDLLESRESIRIQSGAVKIAERRVKSTDLFLQAGRAEIRDVLESQEALVSTRNALASAVVNFRVAGLELQRDLGVLEAGRAAELEGFEWGESVDDGE